MIRETLSAARDLGRLHEIAVVLIRWGFGDLVRRLGMSHTLEKAGRVLRWKDPDLLADLEPPERVCKVLEELGPTFVKLGQMLATRVDLFSPEWIKAFEKLQDQVFPLPFEELIPQLTEDLGAPPETIFASIEKKPLAAASMAQVHRATLQTGETVVLKIRRPEIEKTIEADLRLLRRVAEIAENNMPELKRFRPTEVSRQFSLSLKRELDLEGECRHAERIAKNLKHNNQVVIPSVHWQWTTTRLNVQTYIEGVRASDINNIVEAGLDKKRIANIGAEAIMHMVLVDGFFHADPHLGNIICLPNNRLALIDFGMVGRLSDTRREQLIKLLFALVKKNASGVLDILLDWVPEQDVDETALLMEIDAFLDHYHGLSIKNLHFAALLAELTAVLREHELVLPPDLALLFKTLISLDGVGRKLDPDFNIVEIASPFIFRLVNQKYRPDILAKRGLLQSAELFEVLTSLPGDVQGLTRAVKRKGLKVNVDVKRLDHFGHQLDRAASRVTIGLIVAALIVGTAIVSSIENQPTIWGLPAWGLIGFTGAVLWGVILMVSIWRGNRDS